MALHTILSKIPLKELFFSSQPILSFLSSHLPPGIRAIIIFPLVKDRSIIGLFFLFFTMIV